MVYRTSAVKAIREKCLDCSEGNSNEVRWCPVTKCPLYPFRFGKSPFYNKTEIETAGLMKAFTEGVDVEKPTK